MFILLFFAGAIGGALNGVAGGGSFVTLPTLIFAGIPPVVANATSTFALWPGSISSAVAYRRELRASLRTLAILGSVSLIGGLLGGLLLLSTSDTSFMRLLPWLMLAAAVTFTFGSKATAGVHSEGEMRHRVAWWAVVLQFAISIYGGYFGGGMSIMMLATMAVSGMNDIHEMNGLKALLGTAINGVALVEFLAKGAVVYGPGFAMMAGGITGGYAGAALARQVDRKYVRWLVIAVGWGMTAYFFYR